jgi:hypothetical protein
MKKLMADLILVIALVAMPAAARAAEDDQFNAEQIYQEAADFFGETTEGLAKVIEKIFADLGKPNAFIKGEEISGAFVVGLRYGNGSLHRKSDGGGTKVYWKGPSIGFDFGGNASKVFILVYDLPSDAQIFRRFPGVEGSFYFIAGLGANYQRAGDITLAPIRTGVGLRGGVNVGYMNFTRSNSWVPF